MIIKRCPSFPNYSASNDGRVFSHFVKIKGGYRIDYSVAHELAPYPDEGYLTVGITRDGEQRPVSVHQIVADAFFGPCPDGLEVRHLNGVKTDNQSLNLAYGTQKENGEDRAVLGESARGERNGATSLTAAEVLEIRRRHAAGQNCGELARALSRPRSTIHAIVTRVSWKYL